MAETAYEIDISGVVQGVGFRPFIFRLAKKFGINGYVSNTSKGVHILVEGKKSILDEFLDSINEEKPKISFIDNMEVTIIEKKGIKDFAIKKSEKFSTNSIFITNDLSTCSNCKNDILHFENRRYRYPFTTCTYCGPRYSIIYDIPYDRVSTTMDEFEMCPECQAEYDDPYDRRYHSQPNACTKCGPILAIYTTKEKKFVDIDLEEHIKFIGDVLKKGYIVALKGLGGYQLCCDAKNSDAVMELRRRKQREQKPFAIMCKDLQVASEYCHILKDEKELLLDQRNPIVLMKKRKGSSIAPEISLDNDYLGIMLPYTPIHILLMEEIDVLVMTSANISDMPIISDNNEAIRDLSNISDYILMHDRKIHRRIDDSVYKVVNSKPQAIRRARGYTPGFLKVPNLKKSILAVGGELKNTFAINRGENIFVSPHIGDLKNLETLNLFKKNIAEDIIIFGSVPEVIACDLHPGYLSTIWAEQNHSNVIKVQHHHAHLASTLLENGLMDQEAIGITMDGTGYGTDGAIWGCECGIVSYKEFTRKGHLNYFPLPGGDICAKDVFRCSISLLYQATGIVDPSKYDFLETLEPEKVQIIKEMIDHKINSIPTSSMGRLFDGISCILGLGNSSLYEASAAIRLESIAKTDIKAMYPVVIKEEGYHIWMWEDMLKEILNDLKNEVPVSMISSKFHNSVINYIIKMTNILYNETGLKKVVLSGGVFNNSILSSKAESMLRQSGFDVYLQRIFPAGDGGICLGQMIIANEVI